MIRFSQFTIFTSLLFLLLSQHTFCEEAASIRHRFVATDESGKQLLYVDQFHPENDWTIPFPGNRDVRLVKNNRVLVNLNNGYREYAIETGERVKEVTHGAGIRSAHRLENGHTLLASAQMIWELDANDQEVRAVPLAMGNFFRVLYVNDAGEFLYTGSVSEVKIADANGTVLKAFDLKNYDLKTAKPYFLMPMAKGNYLASSGYGACLLEFTPEGTLVRKIAGRDSIPGLDLNFFASAEILKNGNMVVSHWTGHGRADSKKAPQLLEFDPEGNVVWQWHDAERAGSLHGIAIVE